MKNDGVNFELNGKSFNLRFSHNAFCDLEDHAGADFKDLIKAMQAGSMKALRAFFWAGLRRSVPDFTLDDAGDLIDALGVQTAGELLGKAVEAAFPESKPGKPGAGGNAAT